MVDWLWPVPLSMQRTLWQPPISRPRTIWSRRGWERAFSSAVFSSYSALLSSIGLTYIRFF